MAIRCSKTDQRSRLQTTSHDPMVLALADGTRTVSLYPLRSPVTSISRLCCLLAFSACLFHAAKRVGCSSFGTHLQYPATCIHVEPRHFVASCSSSRILNPSFACAISSFGANSPAVEHQRKPPVGIVRASRPCVSSRTRGSCRPKFWIADTRDWSATGSCAVRRTKAPVQVEVTPIGRDALALSNSYPAKVPRYLGFRTGALFMC